MESEVQRIGRAIFDAIPRRSRSVFDRDFWQRKVMDWSMRDEAFKVEMFRFVDVFPVLDGHEAIARHVQEYFCRPEQDFPAWVRFGLDKVTPGSLVARAAAGQIEKNIRAMARSFVAGEDAAAALPAIERMRSDGIGFTVDLLGESTVSEPESAEYHARYEELIRTLSDAAASWSADPRIDSDDTGPVAPVNVSVKISSLFSQLDPIDPEGSVQGVFERLLPLAVLASERGAFLNLDMEQRALRPTTFRLFQRLLEAPELAGYDELGLVIQAYLRDSLEDVRFVCDLARRTGRRFTVRLVKGAYWDYETIHARQAGWPAPVYGSKWETDASFEACVRLLLDNHEHVRTAVGSHNVRSIAVAAAHVERLGLPREAVEFQMLFGMADELRTAVRSLGYRVRAYVPIGALVPGMAYLVRRLLENTSNEGFLRAGLALEGDADGLLRPPAGESSTGERVTGLGVGGFDSEPWRDFSVAEVRAAFSAALERVRRDLGDTCPLVIGGRPVQTDRTIVSTNPADPDAVVGTVACAGVDHASAAIGAARAAFPAWSSLPAEERSARVRALAELMRERRDELAALMVLEVGKAWREADADVAEAIDFCVYYAAQAERLMGKPVRLGTHPGEWNALTYRPIGVGAVISPWNFPLAILTGMTVGAVVSGNCVVLKPAEQSSVIAARFAGLVERAGIPAGVVNYLPGIGEEVGEFLVGHPQVAFIAFTGSRAVGTTILRRAFDTQPEQPGVKRVVCEMGGKNAIIVDDDADLDEAVAAVVHSAFGFQGQKCSACSRVIVLPGNYDAFVARLAEAVRSLLVGPPSDPRFSYGPVVDCDAEEKVREYIRIGHEEGTPLVVTEPPEGGRFVPFAVFEDIRVEHRLAQEEVFGPVLAVMRAEDFDDALRIANSTEYALTGAVISRSPSNIERARHAFEVGNLYINRGCTGALVGRQPFGGYKYSGVGAKAGGPNYLRQFLVERATSENTMRRGFAPEV